MTHDDINAGIAYGMGAVTFYKHIEHESVATWHVVVKMRPGGFRSELRRPHSALYAMKCGALCIIRISDGVVLAQKAAEAAGDLREVGA